MTIERWSMALLPAKALRLGCVKAFGEARGSRQFARSVGVLPGFFSVDGPDNPAAGGPTVYSAGGMSWMFPGPATSHKLFQIAFGYPSWLKSKYELTGFVSLEPGDLVVDCGAFVGGFSRAAAPIASKVLAVEPSPRNFACMQANVSAAPNVLPFNLGFHRTDGHMTMNLSSTFVDDSFLRPDEGATGEVVEVPVMRLDSWAREQGLERIDFLKLEAEGVETEILESAGSLLIRKIAVDCSPERDGKSNGAEIAQLLTSRGYQVRQHRHMTFARLER